MALHRADERGGDIRAAAMYASDLSARTLPKRRIPGQGVPPAIAEALVHDELLLDGNSRQNLATFCATRVAPEVDRLMRGCIDKNMIDKDEYPQTAEIESRPRRRARCPRSATPCRTPSARWSFWCMDIWRWCCRDSAVGNGDDGANGITRSSGGTETQTKAVRRPGRVAARGWG